MVCEAPNNTINTEVNANGKRKKGNSYGIQIGPQKEAIHSGRSKVLSNIEHVNSFTFN